MLASDFEGVEIIFLAPTFLIAFVVGAVSVFKRWRGLSITVGVFLILMGCFSFYVAHFEKESVARVNQIAGLIYGASGFAFAYFKRKPVPSEPTPILDLLDKYFPQSSALSTFV